VRKRLSYIDTNLFTIAPFCGPGKALCLGLREKRVLITRRKIDW
jgi:hypothetical protein